jgi:hypothetical protein
MMRLKKIIRAKKGDASYIGIAVLMITVATSLAVIVAISPIFIAKQDLDVYADQLIRTAEIAGSVGTDTDAQQNKLTADMGIEPDVRWNRTGNVPLGDTIALELTLICPVKVGSLANFNITLKSKVTGKSEVYWK